MRLNLALLPYTTNRRYLYAIDFTNLYLGILATKRWNSKIKAMAPAGFASRIPLISCDGEVDGRRIQLTSTKYSLKYVSAASIRRTVLERFSFMMIEEPRRHQPARAFKLIRDANKALHNYFVITSENVYAMSFEPDNLTISKYIILKYTVVFIT